MIDIDEALALIESHARPLPSIQRNSVDSLGYTLAEDIFADVDSPPHDKALVDGWAVQVADANSELRILEQVIAGEVPRLPLEPGTASEIMTGAPVPQKAEAMVMTEKCVVSGDTVRVTGDIKLGQAIMKQAAIFAQGDKLLHRGQRIRPIEIGLLHEVGRVSVQCFSRPSVAVLPTGEELVPAIQKPNPGQIRNSNGPMLTARAQQLGCTTHSLEIARDDLSDLRGKIQTGLQSDILILSGGVSMGVKDLVPPTLHELGVQRIFHKVRLKPGKPLWFGVYENSNQRTLVFGLPGNPVSSLVCFEVFVDAAIRRLSGEINMPWNKAELALPMENRGDRTIIAPAILYRSLDACLYANPIDWKYSGDMHAVTQANGWIRLETGQNYAAGDWVSAILMSGSEH